MLGPLARSRALAGVAVLLTIVAGSVGSASGTSATAPTTPLAASGAASVTPVYGPVAAAVPPRPLVRTDGPLLPATGTRLPTGTRLVPVLREVGPFVPSGARRVGPPSAVGPGSPVHQVRAVQRLLRAAGAQLRVDGAWGPATTTAVLRVQAQHGLRLDGRAGPTTLAALRR